MVNKTRRSWVGWATVGLSALLGACVASENGPRRNEEKPTAGLNDPDASLKYRFRGIYGGELRVDASFVTHTSVIFTPEGDFFNIGQGSFAPGGGGVSGYGGHVDGDRLVVPKYLRYLRYPEGAKYIHRNSAYVSSFPPYEGLPLVDVQVPIASRIPDEVLDRIRKYKGSSLALRLRITPDTLLVGWEIKLGSSYPFKKDKAGNDIVTDGDMMVGGDFWPAQPVWELQPNGYIKMIHKKGWQIDPKTGKKIETSF